MTHYKTLHPSAYIGAHDLKGKDVLLTIASVRLLPIRTEHGDEKKPVVNFKELEEHAAKTGDKAQVWVLNRTNAATIAGLHGTEVDDWVGKRITLYQTTCQSFGETVDCIRVRPATTKTK